MLNLIAGSQLLKLLSPYQAVYRDGPIVTSASDSVSATGSPESNNQVPSPTTPLLKKKKKKFPEAGNVTSVLYFNYTVNDLYVYSSLLYWGHNPVWVLASSVVLYHYIFMGCGHSPFPYPWTSLGWVGLPEAYAPASIALQVIGAHKPLHDEAVYVYSVTEKLQGDLFN
jgi:hypothetical protein